MYDVPTLLLSSQVFGEGLGALAHGVLVELAREDQLDSRLDRARVQRTRNTILRGCTRLQQCRPLSPRASPAAS